MNSFNKKINSMFICMCVFFLLPSIQLYYKNSNDLLFYITVWLTRIMAVIVLIKYFKKGTLSKYFCFVFLFCLYCNWYFNTKEWCISSNIASLCYFSYYLLFWNIFQRSPKILYWKYSWFFNSYHYF